MLRILFFKSAEDYWDATACCNRLRHDLKARDLEQVSINLVLDDPSWQLDYLKAGNDVIIERDGRTLFEGVVYERKLAQEERIVCDITAYTHLIRYERHLVYRLYQPGVKAGEIIRDLASLEPGVDVSNVDDGEALLAPWKIENQPALKVMRSIARGINYWLRMKPGKMLYFKPRASGEVKATITENLALAAQYTEDRWELRNRIIYIGAGGQVLADVSDGSGDLPLTIHDPFLTDRGEAERRARMRLNLSKDYGRQLEIIMALEDFEDLGIDLGDTVRADLPKLGLSEDMIVFGIEYDLKSLRVRLILGGRQQLYEEFLAEQIGGDVAAKFGRAMALPEQTSTLAYSLDKIARIQADKKHVLYVNKPPITLYNAQNVILNSNGEVELVSGATEGSFEARVLPPSQLFISWIKAEWMAEKGEKTVSGSPEDWPSRLTDWSYRKKVTIQENAGQDLADYQVKLVIHYSSGTDSGSDIYLNEKCRSDFGDIRLTDSSGNLLPYWMEEKVYSDYAVFWVKVPSIPANGTADIYIYYGNPDAVYDGDPRQVFDWFDQFETDTLGNYTAATLKDPDGSKWGWDSENKMVKGLEDAGKDHFILKNDLSLENYAIKTKVKTSESGSYHGYAGVCIGHTDTDNGATILLYPYHNVIRLHERSGGTDYDTDVDFSCSYDKFYVLEARRYGASVKVYVDGELKASFTLTHYTTSGAPSGLSHGNYYAWFDYLIIRKYVDPEPSISTIGDEEEYTPPQIDGEVSVQFLNADGESLGQVYDAYDTQSYRFRKWPQGYGSFTYRNASSFGVNGASVSDKRMGILHAYCLKLTPSILGSDGEIYYPSNKDLSLDLSWAKWLRLYLYADHESDVTVKIRLHQDASNYFEGSLMVKAKEWRKYEISMSSLSKIGSPSLGKIDWISIISPYPILIDSDHVFLPATRELMRVKFTLKRSSPDDPSPKIRLVKIIWREGA
ncbi:MAG: hypothetical protein DRN59_03360 [Thaumarchaeota archaeon]|nr:MAG: hypothetical protein DRN59_03360 [Nitrososphaerota archaeon]